jgi:hypothetical protein
VINPATTWKLVLGLTAAVSALAQNRLVSNVGNFIHDVGELERSGHFYRDVLGMELQRPPGDWQSTEAVFEDV